MARMHQQDRFKDNLKHNASLTNRDIKEYLQLTNEAEQLLNQAAKRLNISARSYMRVIKVAQTIADLSESDSIDTQHISEALQYRKPTLDLI